MHGKTYTIISMLSSPDLDKIKVMKEGNIPQPPHNFFVTGGKSKLNELYSVRQEEQTLGRTRKPEGAPISGGFS